MSRRRARSFWVTNHLANPILRPLLRSRLGRRLGRRLAVVRYQGRRTGKAYELIAQYVRVGDGIWVVPGQPERKQWWRNMVEPRPVEVWVAGARLAGVAETVRRTDNPDSFAAALAAYLTAFPHVGEADLAVRIDVSDAASGVIGGADESSTTAT